ncbi:hypothetical protein [Hymenobacter sp.]|uniref:hypothetical protein n=1 Tax=Hymenobacter sp. TaxID=1898978 RepID=UPI00286C2D82|nr:hypothetical protein [Hymenobacter sp.]
MSKTLNPDGNKLVHCIGLRRTGAVPQPAADNLMQWQAWGRNTLKHIVETFALLVAQWTWLLSSAVHKPH